MDHFKAQSKRIFELEKKQIYSKAQGDQARAAVIKADAQLVSAKAELEKAKQSLGAKGNKNPKWHALFGGPKNMKFLTSHFRNLLLEIRNEDFLKQKEILDRTIEEWKENVKQTDDILVIGFKLS